MTLAPPAPPPYFSNVHRASTPSYHEPPPEYEATLQGAPNSYDESAVSNTVLPPTSGTTIGMTHSCTCLSNLTTVADDYGKHYKLIFVSTIYV